MSHAASVAHGLSALDLLVAKAAGSAVGGLAYTGEVSPEEAFEFIQHNEAVVVDVRTLPEWQFTGLPDLRGTKGKLATISWKLYPDFSTNAQFAAQLAAIGGVSHDMPLLFLCRSGGRSLDAAVACAALGYNYCFNISDGFEGDADAAGHRSTSRGWKAKRLPWKQS
jgi:rhodanese-related sulfurtransferase